MNITKTLNKLLFACVFIKFLSLVSWMYVVKKDNILLSGITSPYIAFILLFLFNTICMISPVISFYAGGRYKKMQNWSFGKLGVSCFLLLLFIILFKDIDKSPFYYKIKKWILFIDVVVDITYVLIATISIQLFPILPIINTNIDNRASKGK